MQRIPQDALTIEIIRRHKNNKTTRRGNLFKELAEITSLMTVNSAA